MSDPVHAELIQGVEINITPSETNTEVPITIFEVETIDKRSSQPGSWCETFGSEEKLQSFLRGLEAGAMMIGKTYIFRPPIPRCNI